MWEVLCRKKILLLLSTMFQSVFSEAFSLTYNAIYFTVRSRALSSLVASGCVIICNFTLGFWLDWRKPTLNTRAVSAFVVIYAFEAALYIYAMTMTKRYEGMETKLVFDWTDDGFGQGVYVYILMLVGFNLMYDYLCWLVGCFNKNGADLVRLSTIIRGIESAGQVISYGISSIPSFPLSRAIAVNVSFFATCIIPAEFVVFKVGIIDGVKVHDIVQDENPNMQRPGIERSSDIKIDKRVGDAVHVDHQS
ncbi:hypothetical protein MRS44_002439 [Fusarium solani]|uniref:uncharacterized protein n=1 Tax=Fusarium solani TaxID=169388 RepID=UPI00231C792D|nr:hypothetical protein MRS44_002439 [Fusarium solani]KAJ4205868.1 hypothetical protein NW759_014501 [Fusarium solani]